MLEGRGWESRAGEKSRVPDPPEGWTVGPPDFIGIGAQWAGTTWWSSLLTSHPDIVIMSEDAGSLALLEWRPLFADDLAAYHRRFPRRPGSIAGEWSSDYMSKPGVMDHIHACAPEAKLLAILRDPVERYRAGVAQWRERKRSRGRRLNLWAAHRDAYRRGFYGFMLERYLAEFGRERLLVLQLERCIVDPDGEYRRTLAFLGVEGRDLPVDSLDAARIEALRERLPPAEDEPPDLLSTLESDVRHLRSLLPDLDLDLWPNFTQL